jgi:class 3 adenylate cyclase
MSVESKREIQLEIAHVLFIDIVGYSKLSINDQHAAVEELNRIVRASDQFQRAEAANGLIRIPTGDGMVLVFTNNPEAPVECALKISKTLKSHPKLKVRMGIHSGPVNPFADVNDQSNLAGAGINVAQRVMYCGDAGHILLSKHFAEDLEQYAHWRPHLHEGGEVKACRTERTRDWSKASHPSRLRQSRDQAGSREKADQKSEARTLSGVATWPFRVRETRSAFRPRFNRSRLRRFTHGKDSDRLWN